MGRLLLLGLLLLLLLLLLLQKFGQPLVGFLAETASAALAGDSHASCVPAVLCCNGHHLTLTEQLALEGLPGLPGVGLAGLAGER